MYVNAFWFGFLIAIISVIVLLMVIAFISARRQEEEEEITEEDIRQMLEDMTGKKFRIVEHDGHLFAEMMGDAKDEETE